MLLKLGSQGDLVKSLQRFLKITIDGDFGPKTELAVKNWQSSNGITPDGIIGVITWSAMELASTDNREQYQIESNLTMKQYYLPKGEYYTGPTKKEYCFLHHTAGWHNPYNTVDSWGRDNRGRVGTEFVLGGQSILGDNVKYDGELLQCIPEGGYGWHLGDNGSQYMHTNSVGIEVCNFGYLKDGKTYVGTVANNSQKVKLAKPFRGYSEWHRYSNKQIEVLKNWILFIAERDNIDVRKGLVEWIHAKGGHAAFEFSQDAYKGKIKGLLTHTNTRKDKWDMFPQPELIDMLVSL